MRNLSSILVQNLQKYFQSAHIEKAVLGISGGVDSAVTAAIAVQALGHENILALRMPHQDFSSDENLSDARQVSEQLHIPSQEIEISPFCEKFFHLPFTQKQMTKGNIMARVRMILLYALANENNGIVLGTSNKTEILTGFFTKYGDGGVDIEVLGEVWKTEVFQLAQHLQLPQNIHTKPPSAELYLGHTDEKELGLSYPELDSILQKMEGNESFTSTTKKEERVLSLVKNSAHKRGEVPCIPRNSLV